MVSKGDGATDKAAADNLQHGQSSNSETQDSQQSAKNDIHASERHPEGNIPSVVPEKVMKTPDSVIHPLQSDPEGSSPVIREKVLEDGYNWRKYGQKLVKGNEFIRSYYKCTHPNCLVKKQLERSHDGQITDTVYFGQHDHPRPLSTSVASGLVMSITEERQDKASNIAKEKSLDTHGQASDTHGQTPHPIKPNSSDDVKDAPSESNRTRDGADNDTDPGSKRRKKDNFNVEATPPDKPTGELRVVVHTRSEIDIVNDGYRWRKYGQKLVKGNPYPRSYYRCSSPGCPVKKHVERASHDPKLLITTYEGQHDHDMPPARTVTHNTVGSDAKKTASNRDHSGTTKEASDTAPVTMVSHPSSGPESKSSEQLNGNSRVKSGDTGCNTISSPGSSAAGKSNEQQNGRSDATKESDAIGHGEAGAKTKQKGSIGGDLASHVTPHRENNLDEQPQTPTANPIRS